MNKFKVGDRVKLDGVHMGTVLDVSKSPGNVVCEMDDPAIGTEVSQFPGRKVLWLSEDRFTKVRAARKIIITHDGTTTLARLYEDNKVVKRAEAKCAPGDEFSFEVGANLAFDRLMQRFTEAPRPEKPAAEPIKLYCVADEYYRFQNEVDIRGKNDATIHSKYQSWESFCMNNRDMSHCLFPLVQRPAKVGEWVYITEGRAIGVIGKVLDIDPAGRPLVRHRDVWGMFADEDGMERTRFDLSDYLVLDGYQPEPECCKCCGQPLKKESAR